MLTIQIITNNNANTIEKTLESIDKIKAEKIVIDRGSTDKTLDICKKFNVKIAQSNEYDLSKIRNEYSKDLNFYINPWEVLISGHEYLQNTEESSKIYIFQNEVITKDLRIWTNEKFTNPIYEIIINKNAKLQSEIILSSKDAPDDRKEKLSFLKKWNAEKPFDSDVYYYLACCCLSLRDYKNFFKYCEEYYMREDKLTASYIMMKYYCSQVNLHLGNIKKSIEDILYCISFKPEMSEFWCLLGDNYYKQTQYKKSKEFYSNAIIVGKKRKNNDDYPIEIKKYKEYPEKMIENINKILKDINLY